MVPRSKETAVGAVPADPVHAALIHDVTCADWHVLADKRRFGYSNTNATAGTIINDMLTQMLLAEGVYAVKNLFAASVSDCSALTSLSSLGSGTVTLSIDATKSAVGGANSLKVICDGTFANQGFVSTVLSGKFLPSTTYTLSLDLLGGTTPITVSVSAKRNAPFAIMANKTVQLSNGWQRFSLTFTTPAAGSMPDGAHGFNIQVETTPAQAVTFWADGLQYE